MIKTLLFDIGGVLLYFSHERMCTQIAAVCGLSSSVVRQILFEEPVYHAFERGEIGERDYHQQFEEAVGRSVPLEELRLAASDIFELNESIVPVIAGLKQSGYRLVILSNTNATHMAFIRQRFAVFRVFRRRRPVLRGACGQAGRSDFRGRCPEDQLYPAGVLLHGRHPGLRAGGPRARLPRRSL